MTIGIVLAISALAASALLPTATAMSSGDLEEDLSDGFLWCTNINGRLTCFGSAEECYAYLAYAGIGRCWLRA